jgi:fatty acid-binding protein DegV
VLEGGLIDVPEQTRTQGKAIDRMLEMMVERVGTREPVNLAVIHADVPDLGQALLERAKALFNCQTTFLSKLTTSLVVHFGPGTLGLVAYRI